MQIFYLIFTLSVYFFASCKEQTVSQTFAFVDTTKPFKKEIPIYKDGSVNIFYSLAKARQKELKLDNLENGFDNLQIRVWYNFALVREMKLVEITNKDKNWTATVYNLQVDWDGETETLLSKKVKQVTPKSGWSNFSKKLLDLKVLTLPDQDDLPNYHIGMDGRTYNVELATKNQYRFYSYWVPQAYQEKFWQAKNMVNILKLLEQELGVL